MYRINNYNKNKKNYFLRGNRTIDQYNYHATVALEVRIF